MALRIFCVGVFLTLSIWFLLQEPKASFRTILGSILVGIELMNWGSLIVKPIPVRNPTVKLLPDVPNHVSPARVTTALCLHRPYNPTGVLGFPAIDHDSVMTHIVREWLANVGHSHCQNAQVQSSDPYQPQGDKTSGWTYVAPAEDNSGAGHSVPTILTKAVTTIYAQPQTLDSLGPPRSLESAVADWTTVANRFTGAFAKPWQMTIAGGHSRSACLFMRLVKETGSPIPSAAFICKTMSFPVPKVHRVTGRDVKQLRLNRMSRANLLSMIVRGKVRKRKTTVANLVPSAVSEERGNIDSARPEAEEITSLACLAVDTDVSCQTSFDTTPTDNEDILNQFLRQLAKPTKLEPTFLRHAYQVAQPVPDPGRSRADVMPSDDDDVEMSEVDNVQYPQRQRDKDCIMSDEVGCTSSRFILGCPGNCKTSPLATRETRIARLLEFRRRASKASRKAKSTQIEAVGLGKWKRDRFDHDQMDVTKRRGRTQWRIDRLLQVRERLSLRNSVFGC